MSKRDDKPLPPKRPANAYFIFKQDPQIIKKAQDQTQDYKEQTKIIGTMWKEADEQTKAKFNQIFEKNKIQYAKDIVEFEKKYGKVEKKSVSKKKNKKDKDEENDDEEDEAEVQKNKKIVEQVFQKGNLKKDQKDQKMEVKKPEKKENLNEKQQKKSPAKQKKK